MIIFFDMIPSILAVYELFIVIFKKLNIFFYTIPNI